MPFLHAMAIFCEDIREEKNDIITLIGLLPDTVELEPAAPGEAGENATVALIGKLCIYMRFNFDPDAALSVTEIRLVMPDGGIVPMGQVDPDLIAKAKDGAKTKGNIIAGLIFRAAINGFRTPVGVVRVEAIINSEMHTLAALTFKMKEG